MGKKSPTWAYCVCVSAIPAHTLQETCAAAFCPGHPDAAGGELWPPTLLLGDSCSANLGDAEEEKTRLVAIDALTDTVRWTTPSGAFRRVIGIAVLPRHGVAIASSYQDGVLHVHALASGARLASTPLAPRPSSIAADPRSGTVFACTDDGILHVLRWTCHSHKRMSCAGRRNPACPALDGPICGTKQRQWLHDRRRCSRV